jgi:hypothetical protein
MKLTWMRKQDKEEVCEGSQGYEFSVHFNVQQLTETPVTKSMATRD